MWKLGYFGLFGMRRLIGIPTKNYGLFGFFGFLHSLHSLHFLVTEKNNPHKLYKNLILV